MQDCVLFDDAGGIRCGVVDVVLRKGILHQNITSVSQNSKNLM